MTITYHPDLVQGSEEWHAARCGILTASEMCLIVSPPPEPEARVKKNGELYKQREWNPIADNDKCRAHLWELLAQRITKYVEPSYIGDAMLRGIDDQVEASHIYSDKYAMVTDTGFITNDSFGFTIGYSPDGLVGGNGLIEVKSRKQRFQIETIVSGEMPSDYMMQVQTGLLVSERKWCDFISYSGGLPMVTIRVFPDPIIQAAIVQAATAFESRLAAMLAAYNAKLTSGARLIPTERKIIEEMYV